jgi:hypothetical protein
MKIVIIERTDFIAGMLLLICSILLGGSLLWASLMGAWAFALVMPLLLMIGLPLCVTMIVLGCSAIKDSVENIK